MYLTDIVRYICKRTFETKVAQKLRGSLEDLQCITTFLQKSGVTVQMIDKKKKRFKEEKEKALNNTTKNVKEKQ
jgi:hypothetical protein